MHVIEKAPRSKGTVIKYWKKYFKQVVDDYNVRFKINKGNTSPLDAVMTSEIQRTAGHEPTAKCSNEDKWVVDIETGDVFYSVKEAATECCFDLDDLTVYLKRKDNPTCLRYVEAL